MNWKNFLENLMTKDKMKLTNIAIVIVLGVALIIGANILGTAEEPPPLQPSSAQSTPYHINAQQSPQQQQAQQTHEAYLERRLEAILRTVEGVGQVRVMITLSARSNRVYAQNSTTSENSVTETDSAGGQRDQSETSSQKNIFTLNAQGGYQQPLLVREYEPTIEGVIISAQGARDPRIHAEIVAAAQTALGLDQNRVQVLTMAHTN